MGYHSVKDAWILMIQNSMDYHFYLVYEHYSFNELDCLINELQLEYYLTYLVLHI